MHLNARPVTWRGQARTTIAVGVPTVAVILVGGKNDASVGGSLRPQRAVHGEADAARRELHHRAGFHGQRHPSTYRHIAGHAVHHVAFPDLVGRDRPAVILHRQQRWQAVGSLSGHINPVALALFHAVQVVGESGCIGVVLLPGIVGVGRIVGQHTLVADPIQYQGGGTADSVRIAHQVAAAVELDGGPAGLGAGNCQRNVGGHLDPEAHRLVQFGQVMGRPRAVALPLPACRRVDVGPDLRIAAGDGREDGDRIAALRHQGQGDQVPALLKRQFRRGCVLGHSHARPGQPQAGGQDQQANPKNDPRASHHGPPPAPLCLNVPVPHFPPLGGPPQVPLAPRPPLLPPPKWKPAKPRPPYMPV